MHCSVWNHSSRFGRRNWLESKIICALGRKIVENSYRTVWAKITKNNKFKENLPRKIKCVNKLMTRGFIAAYKKFTASRGCCTDFYSEIAISNVVPRAIGPDARKAHIEMCASKIAIFKRSIVKVLKLPIDVTSLWNALCLKRREMNNMNIQILFKKRMRRLKV